MYCKTQAIRSILPDVGEQLYKRAPEDINVKLRLDGILTFEYIFYHINTAELT